MFGGITLPGPGAGDDIEIPVDGTLVLDDYPFLRPLTGGTEVGESWCGSRGPDGTQTDRERERGRGWRGERGTQSTQRRFKWVVRYEYRDDYK